MLRSSHRVATAALSGAVGKRRVHAVIHKESSVNAITSICTSAGKTPLPGLGYPGRGYRADCDPRRTRGRHVISGLGERSMHDAMRKHCSNRGRIGLFALIVALFCGACAFNTPPPANEMPSASPFAIDPVTSIPVDASDQQVTITFGVEEWEADRYAPLIGAFHASQSGVRVQQIVLKDVRAFLQDGVFDYRAMMLDHVRSANVIAARQVTPDLLRDGYVLDLRPLIEADPGFPADDYFPGMLDFGALANGVPLLPSFRLIPTFSYNAELWARAGLPPPAPDWSWDDVLAAAESIAQLGSATDPVYGLATANNADYALLGLLAEAEPELFTQPPEQITLAAPAIERVLQRAMPLADQRVLFVSGASNNDLAAQAALDGLIRSGRVGIWLSTLLQDNPNLTPGFAIGVAAIPPLPLADFEQRIGFAISGGTRHPVAAWSWLRFLADQPGLLAAGGVAAAELPARKSLAEQTGFWERMDDERRAVVEHMIARSPSGRAAVAGGLLRGSLVSVFQLVRRDGLNMRQALIEAQAGFDAEVAAIAAETQPVSETIIVATPVPPAIAEERIRFTAVGLSPAALQPIVEKFRREVPGIDIQLQAAPSGVISIGALADSADCFAYPLTPSPEESASVIDLRPLLDADRTFPHDDFPPALVERMRVDGRLIGLPYRVSVRMVFFDRDLLDEAGLPPPQPGWSIDELVALATQVRQQNGARQVYGLAPSGLSVTDLAFFLSRYGIEPFVERDNALTPNFGDPTLQRQLQQLIDLLRETSPQPALYGYAIDAPELPEAIAMPTLLRFGDSLDPLNGADSAGTGVIAPPVDAAGLDGSDYRVGGLYISRSAAAPEACWSWLRYLSDSVIDLQGGFPARRSLAEAVLAQPEIRPDIRAVYEQYARQWQTPQAARTRMPAISGDAIDPFWFYRAIDRALRGGDLADELRVAQQIHP